MKKSNKAQAAKRNNMMKWLVPVLGITIIVIGFNLLPKKESKPVQLPPQPTTRPAQEVLVQEVDTAAVPPYVPPRNENIDTRVVGVDANPWVDDKRIAQTVQYIWTLRDSPELQTPHDKAIFRLVEEYVTGKKPLRVGPGNFEAKGSNPNAKTWGRLAHTCSGDQYGFSAVQAQDMILVISMYHEILHAADCFGMLERVYSNDDPFDHEPPAYAAQIRMFLALYHRHLIDNIGVSASEKSDAGVLQTTADAWDALLDGRFREWYSNSLKYGSKQLPPGTNVILKEE